MSTVKKVGAKRRNTCATCVALNALEADGTATCSAPSPSLFCFELCCDPNSAQELPSNAWSQFKKSQTCHLKQFLNLKSSAHSAVAEDDIYSPEKIFCAPGNESYCVIVENHSPYQRFFFNPHFQVQSSTVISKLKAGHDILFKLSPLSFQHSQFIGNNWKLTCLLQLSDIKVQVNSRPILKAQ